MTSCFEACSAVSLISDDYIIKKPAPCFLSMLAGCSQHRKVLAKLLQKLLSVDVLGEGVLGLLGRSVAALKVSDLDTGKKTEL